MKKIVKILSVALFVIGFILGGFVLPYFIQFEWGFFGANYISIGDILLLWGSCITFSFLLFMYLYHIFFENRL